VKITTRDIAYNAVVAALYIVLTLITYPVSFLGIQFRFAEILVLLCFFRKDYILGLTLGCLIANLSSAIGLIDVLFGTFATLISCICVAYSKWLLFAVLFPIIFNGVIVGLELFWFLDAPLLESMFFVAMGELGVMVIGYIIFILLKKNKAFHDFIRTNNHVDFKL
jgi:uncharacterized membrane protein